MPSLFSRGRISYEAHLDRVKNWGPAMGSKKEGRMSPFLLPFHFNLHRHLNRRNRMHVINLKPLWPE